MARTDELVRRTLRLLPDMNQQVQYYAKKQDLSANDYILQAIAEKLARENRDYDLPTAEILRLNQMIAAMAGLEAVNKELVRKVDSIHRIMENLAEDDLEVLDRLEAQRQNEIEADYDLSETEPDTGPETHRTMPDPFDDGFESLDTLNIEDMEDLL